MAIPVTCFCGKELRAKDAAAGRRVLCPECNSPIVIPFPDSSASATDRESHDIEENRKSYADHLHNLAKTNHLSKNRPWLIVGAIAALCLVMAVVVIRSRQRQPSVIASPLEGEQANAIDSTDVDLPSAEPAIKPLALENDFESERFQSLLKTVTSHYSGDAAEIVRLISILIPEVAKNGQKLTPEQALEGSLQWPMPGDLSRPGKKMAFIDYCKMYLTYSTELKSSHQATIRIMHVLASAVHFKSKEPPTEAVADAFEAASPGYQLALVESRDQIPNGDPVADYYESLVNQVSKRYGIGSRSISGATAIWMISGQKNQVTCHPAEVLNAAMRWNLLFEEDKNRKREPKFEEFLELYFTFRIKGGKDHKDAIATLCRPEVNQ